MGKHGSSRSGGGKDISITLKPERMRCIAYFFFWTMFIFAKTITSIWVEPMLEAGESEDTDIELRGCGPFNRQGGQFGLKYGEGFTFEESHLVQFFGFGNMCTSWDYHPAREVIAMYFPLFEYFLVMYVVSDYYNTRLSNMRGELPSWYMTIMNIVTPINIILCIWFRMIFVCIAYEQPQGHTAGFLGLQIALMSVSIMNTLYVKCTGQSYQMKCFSLSKSQTAMAANLYIFLNIAISSVKIYATIQIVVNGPYGPDFYKRPSFIPGMVVGELVDYVWLLMNGLLPVVIAYVRMSNEKPITITLAQNAPIYEGDGPQATETTNLIT